MTEEQIQWLKENLFIDVKVHGWGGGMDILIRLGEEVCTWERISASDLKDAIGE